MCAALSIVTDCADAARAAARAADLTAEVLAQELAAIDAGEALGVSKLRTERYIGLHEVEPHVEPAASRLPESADPNPLAPHHATNPDGVRYPLLIADHSPGPPAPKEPPAIPPDLVASLGPEGVQILFNEFRDSPLLDNPDDWWAYCLPALVRSLTGQLAAAENWASYHSGVRERELAQEAIVRGVREERMGEAQARWSRWESAAAVHRPPRFARARRSWLPGGQRRRPDAPSAAGRRPRTGRRETLVVHLVRGPRSRGRSHHWGWAPEQARTRASRRGAVNWMHEFPATGSSISLHHLFRHELLMIFYSQ